MNIVISLSEAQALGMIAATGLLTALTIASTVPRKKVRFLNVLCAIIAICFVIGSMIALIASVTIATK